MRASQALEKRHLRGLADHRTIFCARIRRQFNFACRLHTTLLAACRCKPPPAAVRLFERHTGCSEAHRLPRLMAHVHVRDRLPVVLDDQPSCAHALHALPLQRLVYKYYDSMASFPRPSLVADHLPSSNGMRALLTACRAAPSHSLLGHTRTPLTPHCAPAH